jgi:hypothetical protein
MNWLLVFTRTFTRLRECRSTVHSTQTSGWKFAIERSVERIEGQLFDKYWKAARGPLNRTLHPDGRPGLQQEEDVLVVELFNSSLHFTEIGPVAESNFHVYTPPGRAAGAMNEEGTNYRAHSQAFERAF